VFDVDGGHTGIDPFGSATEFTQITAMSGPRTPCIWRATSRRCLGKPGGISPPFQRPERCCPGRRSQSTRRPQSSPVHERLHRSG
jgi:hypothetical protein